MTVVGKYVLNNEMNEILPKIIAADIAIWAFPLYALGVPEKLYTLIDRVLLTNYII